MSPSVRPTDQGQKVIAAESAFGMILFDDTGQAIYVFDVETTSNTLLRPLCRRLAAPSSPTAPRSPASG